MVIRSAKDSVFQAMVIFLHVERCIHGVAMHRSWKCYSNAMPRAPPIYYLYIDYHDVLDSGNDMILDMVEFLVRISWLEINSYSSVVEENHAYRN